MKKGMLLTALLFMNTVLCCWAQNKNTMSIHPDSNTVYKDEQGNKITEQQFGQYLMQQDKYTAIPEIQNGKIVSLQVKGKEDGKQPVKVGDIAPAFKGSSLDGSVITSDQLKGKIVVMNFWFLACRSCIMEIQELNALQEQYKNDTDVVFLAVTFDAKEPVKKALFKQKFSYHQIVGARDICDAYHISAYPTHVLIDKTGSIYHMKSGYTVGVGQTLNDLIQEIKDNKPAQPINGGKSKIVFDSNSIIEDEHGKILNMEQAIEMINSGKYKTDVVQRNGGNILILKKK